MIIPVLLLAQFFVLLSALISLITIMLTNLRLRETRWLVAAYACATIGTALLLLRGNSHIGLSRIVVNALTMLCYAFIHHAITEFTGETRRMTSTQNLLLAVFFAGLVWYTLPAPSDSARIIVLSLFIALQAGMSAQVLLRYRVTGLRAACATLGWQMTAVALLMLARAVLTLHFGLDAEILSSRSWFQVASIIVFLVSGAVIPLGFFWMTTAREQLRLEQSARTDALTGLLNRRALQEEIEREIARHSRASLPLCALLLDLDHFKELNDRFGHVAGDHALRCVANILNTRRRQTDIVSRYGGEEFVIVLPGSTPEGAHSLAEGIRRLVAATEITWQGARFNVTASFGVACKEPNTAESWENFLARCDRALYMAKDRGRNCVVYEAVDEGQGVTP